LNTLPCTWIQDYGIDMSEPPLDRRLELVYEAATDTLKVQDANLGNARTRANTVLATAALLTSFSTGIGVLNADPARGSVLSPAEAVLLLSVVGILGICVVYVLWPVRQWHFGPSPKVMNDLRLSNHTEAGMREYVVSKMVHGIDENSTNLKKKQWALRAAAVLLVVEVSVLIVLLRT